MDRLTGLFKYLAMLVIFPAIILWGCTSSTRSIRPDPPAETGSPLAASGSPDGIPAEITSTRPVWVDGDSRRYLSSKYLKGVGYAPDRRQAEEMARAEIAKIFFSHIKSVSRTRQTYTQFTSKRQTEFVDRINVDEIIQVSTQKILTGINIAQVFHDPEAGGNYYALAVLDRRRSESVIRNKIKALDREIQFHLTESRRRPDKLAQIKNLKQIMRKYAARRAYETELAVVSASTVENPEPVNIAAVQNRLNAILLDDFVIALNIEGARATAVRDALVDGLNQNGFSITEDTTRAAVSIRGTIAIEPLDRGSADWKYVRWSFALSLVDQKSGTVFGSIHESGREGHLSLPQAQDRAVWKMRRRLIQVVASKLRSYLYDFPAE